MKLKNLVFALLITNLSYSQVGINTTTPTKELDVNGNMRVRGLSNSSGRTATVSAMR